MAANCSEVLLIIIAVELFIGVIGGLILKSYQLFGMPNKSKDLNISY